MTSRTLADAIQAEGLSGTAEEIRSAFNSDVALPFNTELWTYNGVATQFGTSAAEGLGAAIKAAGLEVAYITYATIGFDLSLDQTQEQLETLGNAVPELANLCATMKAIGRPLAKRWQRVGLESLPSESDITAAIAEIDRVTTLRAMIATINTAIVDGETVDAVRQQIAGE